MSPKAPLHVAFDDHCGLCMRFARLVKWLDWNRQIVIDSAHHPRHEKLKTAPDRLQAIQAWDEAAQRQWTGFAAVAAALRRLPLRWLYEPVLIVLEKSTWGDRLYERIAAKRSCRRPSQPETPT